MSTDGINAKPISPKLINGLHMREKCLKENETIQLELNQPVTIKEIKDVLKSLENNKATRDDMISNEILKSGSHILLPSIAKLFNIILSSDKYPRTWNSSYLPTQSWKNEKINTHVHGIARTFPHSVEKTKKLIPTYME